MTAPLEQRPQFERERAFDCHPADGRGAQPQHLEPGSVGADDPAVFAQRHQTFDDGAEPSTWGCRRSRRPPPWRVSNS